MLGEVYEICQTVPLLAPYLVVVMPEDRDSRKVANVIAPVGGSIRSKAATSLPDGCLSDSEGQQMAIRSFTRIP